MTHTAVEAIPDDVMELAREALNFPEDGAVMCIARAILADRARNAPDGGNDGHGFQPNGPGVVGSDLCTICEKTYEDHATATAALAALEPAPKPAGGEWVTVPRADVEFVVRVANRNERTEEGDRLAVLLSTAPTPPAVDAQDVGELLDGFKGVLSHLVAAHSLLSQSPKTGAASNKMFDQMLKDYSASIERGRKLYAAYKRSTTDGQS